MNVDENGLIDFKIVKKISNTFLFCSFVLFFSFLFILIFPNCSRCNISIFDGLATTLPATLKLCNFASSAISFQIGAMVTQLYLSMKILLFDLKVYFPDYNDEYIDNIIIIETCFSS